MPNKEEQEALIGALMKDVTGEDVLNLNKDEINDTIKNILQQYNLRTDLSFIEKIASMKMPGKKEGRVNEKIVFKSKWSFVFCSKFWFAI